VDFDYPSKAMPTKATFRNYNLIRMNGLRFLRRQHSVVGSTLHPEPVAGKGCASLNKTVSGHHLESITYPRTWDRFCETIFFRSF
jgi:hypothetical protein